MISKPAHNNLTTVLDFLKQGLLDEAQAELERVLKNELDNMELDYVLRGLSFWRKRLNEAMQYTNAFERGEYMVAGWQPFLIYFAKQQDYNEVIVDALKCAAFTIAYKFYASLSSVEIGNIPNIEYYRKVGLCYKILGEYDKGLEFLIYANRLDSSSAAIMAELADCYALYGEVKLSKVFFREAFFISPDRIELCFLESEVIRLLIKKTKEFGYNEEVLLEWIPVYGTLDGVFNVKRALSPFECGQLKQKIFLLETDEKAKTGLQHEKIVPRLINYYFWLMDHYLNVNESKTKIDEVLLKIKVLDKDIYNRYIG